MYKPSFLLMQYNYAMDLLNKLILKFKKSYQLYTVSNLYIRQMHIL